MKLIVKFFDKTLYPEGLQKIGGKKSDWIDLRAREDIVLEKGAFKLIPLGVAIKLPDGYEAIIAPRSSTYKNFFVLQTNSIGVVDETYCGDNDEILTFCYKVKEYKKKKWLIPDRVEFEEE